MKYNDSLDLTISRYEPPRNLLEIKYNLVSLFKYFTIWILSLDILYLNSKIENIEFFLIFIHLGIILFCAKLFYFTLKEFKTNIYSAEIILKGKYLILFDIIFHYIPFFIICYLIRKRGKSIMVNRKSILLCLLLPLTYYLFFDTKKIYGISKKKSLNFGIVYTIIFTVIYQIGKSISISG